MEGSVQYGLAVCVSCVRVCLCGRVVCCGVGVCAWVLRLSLCANHIVLMLKTDRTVSSPESKAVHIYQMALTVAAV